jgi:hypothetical protein
MRIIDSPHKFTPRKSKNFRFSLQYTLQFPASEKRFQALEMRDYPHKIKPNRAIFEKKFRVEKHEKIAQIPVFLYTLY